MARLRAFTERFAYKNDVIVPLILVPAIMGFSLIFGYILAHADSSLDILILPIGLLAAVFVLRQPEILAVALLGITWGYISEVMGKYQGLPSISKPLVVMLALAVIWRRVFDKNKGLNQHPLQWWMVAYLLVVCGGMWYAQFPRRTELIIIDFAKEILLLFVILNLVTTERWFERSIWSMLIVGSIIGTLTAYQEFTHDYANEFSGLARSTVAQIAEGVSNRARASGTTGEPNAFGQQMLVLVPLGVWGALYARRLSSRVFGGYTAVVCLLGAGLSFSRGTYLAILTMLVVAVFYLRLNPRYLLILPVAYIALTLAPDDLRTRFGTLNTLLPGAQEENLQSDASIRRRSVEMWVAAYMFFDHPVIGVGADNFVPHYPEYIRELGSDVDDEQRNAHSYYLEIAAEHGVVGLTVIIGIFIVTVKTLNDARRRFKAVKDERMAELSAALLVAFFGYAASATFLHGDYSRFLWLQVDIAAALSLIAIRATAHLPQFNPQLSEQVAQPSQVVA